MHAIFLLNAASSRMESPRSASPPAYFSTQSSKASSSSTSRQLVVVPAGALDSLLLGGFRGRLGPRALRAVVAPAAGEDADQDGEEYAEDKPAGTGGHTQFFTFRGMFECLGPARRPVVPARSSRSSGLRHPSCACCRSRPSRPARQTGSGCRGRRGHSSRCRRPCSSRGVGRRRSARHVATWRASASEPAMSAVHGVRRVGAITWNPRSWADAPSACSETIACAPTRSPN